MLQVPNVEGFEEPFALGPAVSADLGIPAMLGNDVNVAVEAERRFGAGRGVRSFLGVFWGTGVGGGLVVDGRLLTGRGSAGEIGHVCAKPGGRRCNCGLRGCVEAYAGRGALEDRARKESRKRKTVLFDLMRKRGRDRLTSGVWLRALDAGDEVARDLLTEAVEALGVGIGSAVTLLDVEAVVLGGGLGERLGPRWLKRIERAARPHTFFRDAPEYRLAELGDLGGAIGATPARPVRAVLVTGAARGLGAAIADRLAADGLAVVRRDLAGGDVRLDVRDEDAWDERRARARGRRRALGARQLRRPHDRP